MSESQKQPNFHISLSAGDWPDGTPTITVELVNATGYDVHGIEVNWETVRGDPPAAVGRLVVAIASSVVRFSRIAGEAICPPGGRATFALHPGMLRTVASESDALSPDCFRIVVRVSGVEVFDFPGEMAAELISTAEDR